MDGSSRSAVARIARSTLARSALAPSALAAAMLVACGGPVAPAREPLRGTAPAAARPRFESLLDWHLVLEVEHRRCEDAVLAAERARTGLAPRARVLAWQELARRCSFWTGAEQASLEVVLALDSFGRALLAAGYPSDCVALLASLTTPYADGLHVADDDPRAAPMDELRELGERCGAAHEQQRAAFTTAACPGAGCFELVTDPRDHATDDSQYGVCKAVQHGAQVLLATEGPLREPDFCCTLEEVSHLQADATYLRVTGGGRVCGGGTGARTLDAIYRVDGSALVLVHDDSISWHCRTARAARRGCAAAGRSRAR